MSAWRIVDCAATSGHLRSARGQLVIERYTDGSRTPVPVEDVGVLLIGPRMHFSAGAMHRALDAGVAVLFTDWRGVPEGGAYDWSAHTRVAARQMAQVAVSVPRRKNAWGRIVRAKVLGQAQNLVARSPRRASKLRLLAKGIRSGDPDNVEAQAARIYWGGLFDDEFVRSPQAVQGRNVCLDYGYGVLRGLGIKAVLAAGLLPSIGLFHRGRGNAFNLVDDLIEPYRPAVDATVIGLNAAASIEDPPVKQALVASATQRFEEDGARIGPSLVHLAQLLGQYYEGDIARLPVPVWQGPFTEAGDDDEDPAG